MLPPARLLFKLSLPLPTLTVPAPALIMLAPDSAVKLEILRHGEVRTITVTLGQMPDQQQAQAETEGPASTKDVPHLGLSVAPANDVAGAGGKGVAVTGIDPDGLAAQQGIKTGDIILDVDGTKVSTPVDVRNAIKDAHMNGKRAVLMQLKSDEGTKFVGVTIARV